MSKPLCVDLFCFPRRMVKSRDNAKHERRQGPVGTRTQRSNSGWPATAEARPKPPQAWRFELTRASILVVDDDQMRLEHPRQGRLAFVPRSRDNGMRAMVRLPKLYLRHGQETNSASHDRQVSRW